MSISPQKVPVSVLIPTYNRAALLPETVASILAQTYAPEEVIIVDDGSSDNTAGVLERFDTKVKYHRIDNSGVCRARNVAASLATSPYIAFCDSDDLWREDKLAKQMELHLRRPELQHSFTNFSLVQDGIWSQTTKFEEAPSDFFESCSRCEEFSMLCTSPLYEKLLTYQPIFPSTTLLKRSFFHQIGGYTESLGRVLSEDLEFALRCVQHAPIGVITEPVVGIRKHTSNFSGDHARTTSGEVKILEYALANHTLTAPARTLLLDQIPRRRVLASYGAFEAGNFELCNTLLSAVPKSYLTPKLYLKLLISRTPAKVAGVLRRIALRS